MNSRGGCVSVELRRESGTCWIQMIRCSGKSSTVSLVTLSKTVESLKGLPTIADVAKLVNAADIYISKEGLRFSSEESSGRSK